MGSCGGAQVQAVTSQTAPLTGELPSSKSGLGGFIVFGAKRCSALFRFEVRNNKIQGIAFTGRHCGRDSPGGDDGAQVMLDVFTPQGYITDIPVIEEFSTRRAALLAQAKSLEPSSPEAARVLRHLSTTTRFPNKSICSLSSDPSLYMNPDAPLNQQDQFYHKAVEAQTMLQRHTPSHDASCWMYAEVGVYPFELDPSLFQKLEFVGLEDLVKQDENNRAALALAAANSFSTSVSTSAREGWEHDLLTLTGRSRVLSHASGVDFLRWCRTDDAIKTGTFNRIPLGGMDLAAAKKACEAQTQIRQALGPYFKERIWDKSSKSFQEFDVFQKAGEKGYSETSPLSQMEPNSNPPRATRARYFLDDDIISGTYTSISEQQAERLDRMTTAWKTGLGMPSVSVNISVSGMEPTTLGAMRFAQVPLTAFHADRFSVVIDKTPLFNSSFRIFLKKEGSKLSFSRGDSGSLLTLDGYLPVAALNGMGDDVTSAGASVIALPSRRPRAGRGSDEPSSAERRPAPQRNEDGKSSDCG